MEGILLIFGVLIAIGLIIFAVACEWTIFEQFGEAGWKCLIPFYNEVLWFKYTFGDGWFAPLLVWLPNSVIAFLKTVFDDFEGGWFIRAVSAGIGGGLILAVLVIVLLIGELVVYIIKEIKLSKAFGQSGWFTVLLIFLPIVGYGILAFGEPRYLGVDGKGKKK